MTERVGARDLKVGQRVKIEGGSLTWEVREQGSYWKFLVGPIVSKYILNNDTRKFTVVEEAE